ncbi:hypothetical protein [Nocardia neocaledoniensis]|uniref:hypothetical protein n=1 Tax=Nocardia neocaledoniensis TaxID=236511 RepID=UPI0024543926|nr:hypothetical protein [Nocardia neocaledoniensis]
MQFTHGNSPRSQCWCDGCRQPNAAIVAAARKTLDANPDATTEELAKVDGVLPAGRMRELHAAPAARVADLIHRGQDEGAFRTDLPLDWLVDTVYYVLNGAAEGLRTGRLAAADADRVVIATVRSVLTA